MDHGLELITARLEILEIGVCNILQNPGKRIFLIRSYPGNIGKLIFLNFSYPGNIGKRFFSTSSYPGNIGSYDPYSVLSWKYWIVRSILSSILEIVDRTIHTQSYPGNSGSYDPNLSPMSMSRGVAGVAGGRRRRRRPINSAIWPEPWTIMPRDQISRSGSIPHFDKS